MHRVRVPTWGLPSPPRTVVITPGECERKGIRKPAYFDKWVNLKDLYADFYKVRLGLGLSLGLGSGLGLGLGVGLGLGLG